MDNASPILERRAVQRRRLRLAIMLCMLVIGVEIYFEMAQRRHQSQQCLERLGHTLGPMAKVWAEANGQKMPTNYSCLANIPGVTDQPRFWVCPSDLRNPMATERNWSRFEPRLADYELISRGVSAADTNAILFRCKIHGYVGYVDGSVFDGKTRSWPTNVTIRIAVP